LEPEVYCGHV